EQDLLRSAKSRHAQYSILDIAALVPARDQNADREFAVRKLAHRAADEIRSQAKFSNPGQGRNETVDEGTEPEPALRQKLPLLGADDLEIGEIHQIEKVGGGNVVDLGLPGP